MRAREFSHFVAARSATPLPRRFAVAACGLILTAITVTDRQAVLAGAYTAHQALVDSGAGLDLTVGVPLVMWWVLGRDLHWKVGTLVPLFFGSLLLARLTLPRGHEDGLVLAHLAAVPLELVSLAFLARKVMVGRRAFRRGTGRTTPEDVQADLQRATVEALGPGRFAEAVAYEMSVFCYGLFAPGYDPMAADARTYHRKTAYGAIVYVLLMATVAEVVSVHLLVSLWSRRLAWLSSGLGLYGALWLWADWRACRLLPVRVQEGTLCIRFGLRWRLDVPLDAIAKIRAPTAGEQTTKSELDLRLALPGATWKVLELDRPICARGIYGRRRTIRTLGLGLDEFDGLDLSA